MAFLRNYHSLFATAWMWTAWSAMVAICFRQPKARADLAGLLFVLPLAPILGALIDPEALGRAVRAVAEVLMPEAWYGASVARHGLLAALLLIPGMILGFAVGTGVRRRPLALGFAIAAATALLSPWRSPPLESIALVLVPGALIVASLLGGGRWRAGLSTLAVLVIALPHPSAWWLLAALSWATFYWAGEIPERQLRYGRAILLAVVVIQVAVCAAVVSARSTRLAPNYDWEPELGAPFEVLYQSLDEPPEGRGRVPGPRRRR
jgi:hypothetical protein